MSNTLEDIEHNYWGDAPADASHLVRTSHALRKKDIEHLNIEDLRILISQNISLEILIPRAMDRLRENLMAEGDLYEGDLLKSMLGSSKNYWNTHRNSKEELIRLFISNSHLLEKYDTTESIKESLQTAFLTFKD